MKNKKSESDINRKNHFATSLIIPLSFVVIGIIVSIGISATVVEGIVLTVLLGIASNQLQQNFHDAMHSLITEKNQKDIKDNINDLIILSEIQDKITQIEHPYFRKLAKDCLESSFEQIKGLNEGIHNVPLHADDIFISELGINSTKSSIKATSHTWNYKDKGFSKRYLEQQITLRKKGVHIQRIMLMNKEELKEYIPIMEEQHKINIEIRFIFKDGDDNEFIDKRLLSEDYIIQDEALLIQTIYSNNENQLLNPVLENPQLIAINEKLVKEKLSDFYKLFSRAHKYPDDIPSDIGKSESLSDE